MIRAIIISFIFILSLVFIFQNQNVFLTEFNISLDFFVFSFEERILNNAVLIVSSFLIGALITLVSIGLGTIKKSREIANLKKKISLTSVKNENEEK